MNEIGMNEIGMNELEMNEMPPREEQMTQTKNATKQKRNSGTVRQSQGGVNRVRDIRIKSPQLASLPVATSELQFRCTPKTNPVMAGNHAGADLSEFKQIGASAPFATLLESRLTLVPRWRGLMLPDKR